MDKVYTRDQGVREFSPDTSSIKSEILPSSKAEMDEALQDLQIHRSTWIGLDLDEKILILDEIMHDFNQIAEAWVTTSYESKGAAANLISQGEEWFYAAMTNRLIRLLKTSLLGIKRYGRPIIPGPISAREDGQLIVQVFPQTVIDRIMLRGVKAEVYIEPGIMLEELVPTQAGAYHTGEQEGRTTLVLGAGNTSFLVPGDFLNKLFIEGHVVIFKPNPTNDYLGPLIERGFQALIKRGFLRVVYGDANEGEYLCHHALVDEIHMTGSKKTFETIVFGPGEVGEKNKQNRQPILEKPFSAELGNITPLIVVPGDWSESELREQAVKVASWLVFNAGYACPSPRLVIQSRNWHLRQEFNEAIMQVFQSVDTRLAYYPGSREIYKQFINAHPDANLLGDPSEGHLPWTYITDLDADNLDDICFNREAFCGLLSETAVDGASIPDFLENAVEVVNEHVWGTLHAIVIVHPESIASQKNREAFEKAVSDLRYGTVAINQYPAISYYIGMTTWGGFPGRDCYDIQSGVGFTNNTLMFAQPQKSVLRAPFSIYPDPFTVRNKRPVEFGRMMVDFEASPSLLKIPKIMWCVLRS